MNPFVIFNFIMAVYTSFILVTNWKRASESPAMLTIFVVANAVQYVLVYAVWGII